MPSHALSDIFGILVAVAAAGALVCVPGIALARLFRFAEGPDDPPRWLAGLVLGLAILPLADSLALRLVEPTGALCLHLGLGVCSLVLAIRDGRRRAFARPSLMGCAILLLWLVLLLFETVDFEIGGRLFQPFTVIDMVKHAAVTQAITDTGVPPRDPFFLRPERVGYYYYFYSTASLVQRLSGGLADARAAVCGLIFWTGIGLYGLLRIAMAACGAPARKGLTLLVVAILAAGGLDILGVLRLGLMQGVWLAEPVAWNEQITGWFESLLWVPHHVTALIAASIGLVAASGGAEEDGDARRLALLAGLCFATTFGLSLWVALALIATVAVWALVLTGERCWRLLVRLSGASLLGAILSIPQLFDLLAGRHAGASPIAFTVRAFSPIEASGLDGVALHLARLAALPLNYFVAFGVLASGAMLYWAQRRHGARLFATEFARVLLIMAGVGLTLGAFLKSTMINNDLGWRVALFPLLAGTVWTVLAIQSHASVRSASRAFGVMLMLGWATTLYGVFSLRAYPLLPTDTADRFLAAHPETEAALRTAYAWADGHLPPQAVLQHDPARPRAFAFALYGRHRVAVADQFGAIFGASQADVDRRIARLAPIFAEVLPAQRIAALLKDEKIDHVVVTQDDPIWRAPRSFVWQATPAYSSAAVRIIAREAIATAQGAAVTAAASLDASQK